MGGLLGHAECFGNLSPGPARLQGLRDHAHFILIRKLAKGDHGRERGRNVARIGKVPSQVHAVNDS